jgi:hypothetical protein
MRDRVICAQCCMFWYRNWVGYLVRSGEEKVEGAGDGIVHAYLLSITTALVGDGERVM